MNQMHWIWTHLSFTLVVATTLSVVLAAMGRRVINFQRPRFRLMTEETAAVERQRFTVIAIASLVISVALSVVPVGDVDLSGHMLAYSGELSFATLFFLSVMFARKIASGGQRFDQTPWHGAQWVWTIGGLIVYTIALSGRGPDIYALGYGPLLAWICIAMSAAAAISQRWLVASLSLGIVLAWQFRLAGAVNLLDYAVDPFIFVGSAVQTSARVCGSCVRVGTKWRVGRKLEVATDNVVSKAA